MNVTAFRSLLAEHPEKNVRFVFPDGGRIPAHYHVTEVGQVRKDFMDCGGTVRSSAACVLQTWVAADEEHRLNAGKLDDILQLAAGHFALADLSVEVEYEEEVISQYPLADATIESGELLFHLTTKHTDCLAKESCGVESGCGPAGC